MKIVLEKSEAEEYFYNALCNGIAYISGYGIIVDYDKKAYKDAKESLLAKQQYPCYEDVLMEILRMGGTLKTIDEENDDKEYNKEITLEMVHERVAQTPFSHLVNMVDGNDDATTADVILQTVFFQEVIFG
jgi:hypothetical protein